jgi:protein involved in polysaccharide export with SLBB domain
VNLRHIALCALIAAAAAAPQLALAQGLPAPPSDASSVRTNLVPGDVIRLRIWLEPDLSGEFPVDETGAVMLPRFGRMLVTGVRPDDLRQEIVRRYAEVLSHTSVEVTLLRRVQILGAVRNPGLYPVDATMTLGDALALAGGTTPQGHPDRVVLVRRAAGGRITATRRTLISETPLGSGDEIFVPERNWVSRNPAVVGGLAAAIVGLIATLTR